MLTWLQRRMLPPMLGRKMSLLIFASVGLVPVGQAISGGLMKRSFVGLFAIAGVLIILIALRAGLMPEARAMGLELDESGHIPDAH